MDVTEINTQKGVIEGVLWSSLQKWGEKSIGLIVFVILARKIQPESFGLVALAGVFIAFVQAFVDQGFASAIVQRQNLEDEHLNTAFWTSLAIGALMTGCSIVAADPISKLFGEERLAPLIRWLSLTFLIFALSGVQEALFRRSLNFKILSLCALIAQSVGGLVGVAMAFSGYGVWSLVGHSLVIQGISTAILWKSSSWAPKFHISVRHFKDLFAFGSYVLGTNILNFLNRRSDDLLIGIFLGPIALGYYTVAYRVLLAITELVTGVVSRVTFPLFSKLKEEPEQMRRAFYAATQYISLVSFPVFISLAIMAPETVTVFFGKQWSPSIPVMQVLAFIGILHSVYFFNGSIMLAMGKSSWRFWLSLVNSISNVIAFAVAVKWGIVAIAAAYVIRGYLLSPLPLIAVQKLIKIDITVYLRQFIVPLAGSVLMSAVLILFSNLFASALVGHLYLILGLKVAVAMVLYLLTVFIAVPFLPQNTFSQFKSAISGNI